jgi:hypothetical protein
METRRGALVSFLTRFHETADMVFVLHDSATHTRASAWYTSDDNARGTVAYTYDGTARSHGRFCSVPGSCAIPITVDTTGMTALHEFGHAGSDFANGIVADLYYDNSLGGFEINKKYRARATDAVPATFATYNGTAVAGDPNRDGLGYPNTWVSYHPQPLDATRPNLMDNYWLAFDTPHRCRLDQLTYAWFRDRLLAKLKR